MMPRKSDDGIIKALIEALLNNRWVGVIVIIFLLWLVVTFFDIVMGIKIFA